jgi:hypothetical protein
VFDFVGGIYVPMLCGDFSSSHEDHGMHGDATGTITYVDSYANTSAPGYTHTHITFPGTKTKVYFQGAFPDGVFAAHLHIGVCSSVENDHFDGMETGEADAVTENRPVVICQ